MSYEMATRGIPLWAVHIHRHRIMCFYGNIKINLVITVITTWCEQNFSSRPNKTHLNQLRITKNLQAGVLELNSGPPGAVLDTCTPVWILSSSCLELYVAICIIVVSVY